MQDRRQSLLMYACSSAWSSAGNATLTLGVFCDRHAGCLRRTVQRRRRTVRRWRAYASSCRLSMNSVGVIYALRGNGDGLLESWCSFQQWFDIFIPKFSTENWGRLDWSNVIKVHQTRQWSNCKITTRGKFSPSLPLSPPSPFLFPYPFLSLSLRSMPLKSS